jgi:hypothetical protein
LEGLSFKPQLSLTRDEAEAASLHLPMTVGNHFNGQIGPNLMVKQFLFLFFVFSFKIRHVVSFFGILSYYVKTGGYL